MLQIFDFNIKKVYIDKLGDLDNETTIHIIEPLKTKPDVKGSKYTDFGVRNSENDSKFQVGNRVKTSK